MVSVFNEENHIFDGFMDTATKLFASEIPMYYTRGNHETRGAFATEFQRYFSAKEENIYYTFRQGPICFVILDTGEDKPDSDIEYAGITVYDEYRTEQAEWLRRVLDSKEYKDAPFKIIVAISHRSADGMETWKWSRNSCLCYAMPSRTLCCVVTSTVSSIRMQRIVHRSRLSSIPIQLF